MENGNEKSDTEIVIKNNDLKCGFGPCKPRWLLPCVSIKLFTIMLSILVLCHGAQSTYVLAVLTTIEKALQIRSAKSGFIASSNDIGFLSTVVLASFLASKAHKPFVIGVSSIVVGVGAIICTTPYFIFRPEPDVDGRFADIDGVMFGNATSFPSSNFRDKDLCHRELTVENVTSYSNLCDSDQSVEENTKSVASYAIIVVGQIILGIAVSPIWSLGMTFIDDNVEKHSAPMYMGILFSIRTLSPLVGFSIGAAFLSIPLDMNPTDLTPRDPEFIGAWWFGLLVIGMAIIAISIPMLMFPSRMPDYAPSSSQMVDLSNDEEKKENTEEEENILQMSSTNEKIIIKDFPRAIVRLFRNPVYTLEVAMSCVNMFFVVGFYSFMPKYVEKQFNFPPSTASMLFGTISALPTCLGTICGGIIVSKMKMSLHQIIRLTFISSLITTTIFSSTIAVGCDQAPMFGLVQQDQMNFSHPCNADCSCIPTNYDPVCASDGTSYYSPCHAGCSAPPAGKDYFNCTCLETGTTAQHGNCAPECNSFIPFALLTFIHSFVATIALVPGITLVFRTVEPRDKALSIGMLTFLVSLIGIPSPVMFGAIIDSVCMLHHYCSMEVCQLYSLVELRYKFTGVAMAFRIPHFLFSGLLWYIIKRRYDENDKMRK